MDDDAIPRRDAVVGLGLMVTLLVALVGTIGVRIANSSRDEAGPPQRSPATIAATIDAVAEEAAIASTMEPLGAPEASTGQGAVEVQQATHEQVAPQQLTEEAPAARPTPPSGPAESRYSEAPRFVAPSSR